MGGGRLSFVGLSGGFGTLTLGQVWNAAYNSVGAITDNAYAFGDSETGYRHGHAVSYAVSVENISIQVDSIMNKDGGATADKNVDKLELGVSMGLGESGKIAFAHISHDKPVDVKKSSNLIAGEYTIGAMTAYLGFAQHKLTDKSGDAELAGDVTHIASQTDKTTFAGVRGGVGDTGVSYLFQARSKKSSGTVESESECKPVMPRQIFLRTNTHHGYWVCPEALVVVRACT